MKTVYIFLLSVMAASFAYAQSNSMLTTNLKTLDGVTVSSEEAIKPGSQTMLVLWGSANPKCVENLDNLQELWIDSLKNTGVNFVSVCVDVNGFYGKIRPYVLGNGWEFDTYIDVYGDFTRAVGANEFPCTILLDSDNNQIVRYEGFPAGSEDVLNTMAGNHSIAYVQR